MARLRLALEGGTRRLGPVSLHGLLRHGTIEVVTRPVCIPRPSWLLRSLISRLRLMPARHRRRMLDDRSRWHGSKRNDRTPSDRDRRISVSRRKRATTNHRAAVHGKQWNRPADDGPPRQDRARDRPVSRR